MKVVLVTTENLSCFSPFLPAKIVKQLAFPQWLALGAIEDGVAVGAIAARYREGVLSVEWIGVSPSWQGRHIASGLVGRLQRAVQGGNTERITVCFEHQPYRGPLCSVFLNHGFDFAEAPAVLYETSLNEIALPSGNGVPASNSVKTLEDIPSYRLLAFSSRLDGFSVHPTVLPMQKADYLPCSCAFAVGERIDGICLLREDGDAVELSYLYASQPQMLPVMLIPSLQKLRSTHDGQTAFRVWAGTDAACRLADRLLPRADKKPVIAMEYVFEEEI